MILTITSCVLVSEEPEPLQPEQKIVMLDFSENLSTFNSEWVYSSVNHLRIDDADEVEKIIFEASVRSQSLEHQCEVELYNYSIGRTVPFSTVRSVDNYVIHAVQSGDISNYIPGGAFQLGFRMRSTRDNHLVGVTKARLYVFYKLND